ncbi:MAG: hypothetical protein QM770_00120 [Tepidisphaeraceae bacterium]
MTRIRFIKRQHWPQLERCACKAASIAWDIPIDRLRCRMVPQGFLSKSRFYPVKTFRGQLLHATMVSWNAVEPCKPFPIVVAESTVASLLGPELAKGVAELICLHGLNTLDDETYAHVMEQADRIDYEPWMIESGAELWRRLLAAVPEGRTPAEVLMQLALLPPLAMESVVEAFIENADSGRHAIELLFD